jgi:hypothetical protein
MTIHHEGLQKTSQSASKRDGLHADIRTKRYHSNNLPSNVALEPMTQSTGRRTWVPEAVELVRDHEPYELSFCGSVEGFASAYIHTGRGLRCVWKCTRPVPLN